MSTLPRIDTHNPEEFYRALDAILNRGIKFQDNVDCRLVSYTSNASPDTQDSVTHTLGKIPTGFIVVLKDKAGDFYKSASFTSTALKLKCSVASVTATLIVF